MFGKAAVQSSHIRSANGPQPTRLPTFWSPSRRLEGDVRSTAGSPWADEESLRLDWSGQSWCTGRWHTRRIKKVQIRSLTTALRDQQFNTYARTHRQHNQGPYFIFVSLLAVSGFFYISIIVQWHPVKLQAASFGTKYRAFHLAQATVLFSNCAVSR